MKPKWMFLLLLTVALGISGLSISKAYSAPATPAGIVSAGQEPGGWDAPPPEFRDVQRQGFHDGIEGARKDFDNHRQPNVRNREEYRHPHVDASMRDDYREGFRRGYDVAMRHLEGHQ